MIRIDQPCAVIFKEDGLGTTNAVASGQPNEPWLTLQVEINLEISHCLQTPSSA